MAGPIERGQVRWYTSPAPDRRRPVVVLTRDPIIAYPGGITVAPITSAVRDIPTEVVLAKSDGLPKDCATNCDHIQTVAGAKIGPAIAPSSPAKLAQLRWAIAFALDL